MPWNFIVGNIIIVMGVIFMLFGVVGVFKFNNFYARMIVSSKIDIVGLITLVLGISLRHGFTFFTFKMWVIVVVVMILNPLVSHVLTRSAYDSGYLTTQNDRTAQQPQIKA